MRAKLDNWKALQVGRGYRRVRRLGRGFRGAALPQVGCLTAASGCGNEPDSYDGWKTSSQNDSSHTPGVFDKAYYLDKPSLPTVLVLPLSPPLPGVKPSSFYNQPGDKHIGSDSPRWVFWGLLLLCISPWSSVFLCRQREAHMRSFTGASPTPSFLKGGTTFFFQASFQGRLAFTILKRNGNPQAFHFRLSRNLVKWPACQRPQQ